MPSNHTVTNEIKQSPVNYSHVTQTITPDYTGIYAFCGTIIFLGILLYTVIYKIFEKWRLTHFKLKQEEILKNGEDNIRLIKKLDKILEILIDGTCEQYNSNNNRDNSIN